MSSSPLLRTDAFLVCGEIFYALGGASHPTASCSCHIKLHPTPVIDAPAPIFNKPITNNQLCIRLHPLTIHTSNGAHNKRFKPLEFRPPLLWHHRLACNATNANCNITHMVYTPLWHSTIFNYCITHKHSREHMNSNTT